MAMPGPRNTLLYPELQAMRLTADQEVSSHSYLRDHYLGWGQRLNIYVLFASAIVLFFTLATDIFIERTLGWSPDSYKWVHSTTVFATFCLSLIDLAWNPASKAKAHDQAVSHYLRMSYEVSNALTGGKEISAEKLRWIQDEFLDTADMPRIPEQDAMRFKQRHLVKLALAAMLEQNPHQPLWYMKARLWWDPSLAQPKAAALASKPEQG